MEIQKQQADQDQQPDPEADKRAVDSVAKPAAFRSFEEAVTASGLLAGKPPVAPGETGVSTYLVQPTQLLSWYPRHALTPPAVAPLVPLLCSHAYICYDASNRQLPCRCCRVAPISSLLRRHCSCHRAGHASLCDPRTYAHIRRRSCSARRSYLYPGFIDAERADHVVKMAKARLAPSGLALRKGDRAEDQRCVQLSVAVSYGTC